MIGRLFFRWSFILDILAIDFYGFPKISLVKILWDGMLCLLS